MSLWFPDQPEEEEPNYRVKLAMALPALTLFYFTLGWQLLYGHGSATADLSAGPVETRNFLINRLFFPAMAALGLFCLVAERHRLARFNGAGIALFGGLILYLAMAAGWALAPATSLNKLVLLAMQVISLLPALLLARHADEVIRPLFWVMALTLAINAVAVVLLPATPIGHAGIYAHKNTLGSMAALSGIFGIYGLTRGNERVRLAGFIMLPLALLLLYLSKSKTALGLFLISPFIALAALGIWRYLRIALPVLLVVTAVPAVFLLAGGIPGFSYKTLSALVTGDATFTGRTQLWDFALAHIAERPFTGYGYQSFWGIGAASPAASQPDGFLQRTPHAHNGYLDLMLQGGLVAFSLFMLLLLAATRWTGLICDRDPGLGYFVAVTLVYLILLNLLETVWLQGLSGPSMLATLLLLMATVNRKGRALT